MKSRAALVCVFLASCAGGHTEPDHPPLRQTGHSARTAPVPASAEPASPAPGLPAPSTGSAAPGPDLGALPALSNPSLERSAACREAVCRLAGWLPDPAFSNTTLENKPSPAALWLHEIRAGSTLDIPRHEELDLLALVLAGSIIVTADDLAQSSKLDVWSALYAPGAGCSLRANSGDAKLVLAVVSGTRPLSAAFIETRQLHRQYSWRKRPGPLQTSDLAATRDLAWGRGAFHARIAFGTETGSARRSSLETLITAADAAIPEHDHPTWEHIAILQGGGTFRLGGAEHPVKPGTIFHIPPGVKHAFAAGGTDAIVAVQLYTPSGPEQRFVQLANQEQATK